MLTIDCRDVASIKSELVVYVSDQVAAIPTLKINEFMLSSLNDEKIDKSIVITAIKEFLESIGEGQNFAVISNNDIIMIKSISGKMIQRESKSTYGLFSCTHCGFVTSYEVELQNHMKIHYL
ncbi:MAG: C2H2-type zinc finger protein [Nitrosarchaeum sp.]|nr:C2H2-type zinc finger protein [Nitrosarchaeum sp.]